MTDNDTDADQQGDSLVSQAPDSTASAFHPSLGLPDDELVYRVCPLFPTSPAPRDTSLLSLTIPPASVPLIFAHRQWRAGLILADLIAAAAAAAEDDEHVLDMKDQTVLELGCGTGVPGMVSHRAGAHVSILTDYASDPLIATLSRNLKRNFEPSEIKSGIRALGYCWGTQTEDIIDVCDSLARERAKLGLQQRLEVTSGRFSRILLADCLWDSLSHQVLVKSLDALLAKDDVPGSMPAIVVVSGFHTGREVLVGFMRRAARAGFVLVDVNGKGTLLPGLPPDEEQSAAQEQSKLQSSGDPLCNAPKVVYELELSTDEAPASSSKVIDAGSTPRLTGRRRAFVLDERPEERKEAGGVHIRNRWITVWALGRRHRGWTSSAAGEGIV